MKTQSPTFFQRLFRKSQARDGGQTHKDRVLAYKLYRTFEHELERAQVQGVHFYVMNGTVTLYGAISHTLDRDLLVSLVEQLAGVTAVSSHLQVIEQRPALEPIASV